jgi:hypothetical protein
MSDGELDAMAQQLVREKVAQYASLFMQG